MLLLVVTCVSRLAVNIPNATPNALPITPAMTDFTPQLFIISSCKGLQQQDGGVVVVMYARMYNSSLHGRPSKVARKFWVFAKQTDQGSVQQVSTKITHDQGASIHMGKRRSRS
jgi:hypothetical protein